MGRRRQSDMHLPWRMYHHRNAYYFISTSRQRISLGSDLGDALLAYRRIVGSGTIGRAASGQHLGRAMHRNAQQGANIRNIQFDLKISDVVRLLERAGGCCELTGISFSFEVHDPSAKRPWAPSLDRIDSSGPYQYENCRIVCAAVNIALSNFGDDILRRIAVTLCNRHFTHGEFITKVSDHFHAGDCYLG